MKRIERNTLNALRRNVNPDTIYVEIPISWTKEGRQAIHEMLIIEKHMHAVRRCPNVLTGEPIVLYARGAVPGHIPGDVEEITAALPVSPLCWNGYRPDNYTA